MRSNTLSTVLSASVLVGGLCAAGCAAPEPAETTDAQNLFERNCPHEELDAVLQCDEPGQGVLRFEQHVGRYLLEERSVEEDMTGAQELRCEYGPDPEVAWESEYVLDGAARTVSSLEGLDELVRQLPDLDGEALDEVLPSLDRPMAVIRYELGFWGRGEVTYHGLFTGLESFVPSPSDDPLTAKTSFVIDETAYDAGFGGTYCTGLSCRLTLQPPAR